MFGIEERFPAPETFSGASDQLHELAARESGSTDFFGDEYRLGLRVLLESMDYDPRFSERGRNIAWGWLVDSLSARGHAARAFREHPQTASAPVKGPVVITGLHRTGTTALHKLLAVDERFQGLQGWLLSAPMPRPPRASWEGNPHFRKACDQLAARFESVPGMKAAHDMVADEVDECVGILCQSFVNTLWTCAWSASSYDAWWQTQDEGPAFRYHRRVLQLIGSSEPGKRWLLKEPSHVRNLALLLETYPDARIIQTHRDPARAVPSLCSLLIQQHPLMEVGRLDQRARIMGYRETAKAAEGLRTAEPLRRAHQDQILDIRHADLHRDPMGTIRKIYPFLGMDLTPEVEAAMERRVAEAPEAVHGAHSYRATDFGLTEDEIREQFGDYLDRFDLWP
ncbi:MAG: sulfotransferase [Novosphingobium sp.]|nr:sulfotransferase [Novosphingobium sp.]MCP5403719.1 sulfotransferase [Novosphingobium sp.]